MSSSYPDLADRLPPTLAFVETGAEGGHAMMCGGLTVLERVLWGLPKRGIVVAHVAAEPMPLRVDLPVLVEWVRPGSGAPPEAVVVRGDEVLGKRVVDAASCRAAEWALCLQLAKGHQGLIDGWLNWRVSMPITRRLASTKVTPNQVTLASTAVGLAAAISVAGGSWPALALGGVLMQLQSILDSCDGELARLRFQGSKLGQWLDNLSDDLLDVAFVVGAGVAAGGAWCTLAVIASGLRVFGQAVMYHEVYRRTGSGDAYSFRIWFERDKGEVQEVFGVKGVGGHLRALFRRDTYVFAWMLLCLCGQVEAVVVYGSILGGMIGVLMALHLLLRGPLPPPRA